ncbi:MAG: uroporphyrinogen decarboxylase family protein [Saccharofermentanales bacterium]
MENQFEAHNLQVRQVWEKYYAGVPERIPMQISANPRMILLERRLNPDNLSFHDYFTDPEIMWQTQLDFAYFLRHDIYADHEMGIPKDGWTVNVDFQNVVEAAWLGSEIHYPVFNVPATVPYLHDNHKYDLLNKGIPDPFDGIMGQIRDYYNLFRKKVANGAEYRGAPVSAVNSVYLASDGTDGPFTIACNLRGTQEFCIDLYENPGYAGEMLDFLTDAIIAKIKAWRRYFGLPLYSDRLAFADDSAALMSDDMYREFVLPRHKRLIDALSTGEKPHMMHLCGNASHLFRTLRDELDVKEFDTGFPIRHGELVRELGQEVTIHGGPTSQLLLGGTREEVVSETRRILMEVKASSQKFIIKEANNLCPCTPPGNVLAMYETVQEFGRF